MQGLKVKSTDFLEITDESVDLATEYINSIRSEERRVGKEC